MTKPRAPISVGHALDRIAGQMPGGYDQMAEIFGLESGDTVRAWGNPDKPERQLWFDRAIVLDIAFQRAGGDGRPLFETYALQCEVAREDAFAEEVEILRRACTLIRENAEAQEAVVQAGLPTAGLHDRTHAVRQLEDVVREATGIIRLLTRALPAGQPP